MEELLYNITFLFFFSFFPAATHKNLALSHICLQGFV